LPQKDRTDWLAVVLLLVIFALLFAALMDLGTSGAVKFLGR
jgi:preprotein translocase subunit SecE